MLQIWDAETGESILGGYVNNTSDQSFGDYVDLPFGGDWSPQGDRIISTSFGGSGATIWNARSGEKMSVFTGHTAGLTFPAWSPNGKRVATGDTSGVI